jgi:flagellar biosynthesis GTPase FlhF
MDLETLINIVLVFFFLLITTLVRGLKAKQKQQKKKVRKQKQPAKPSPFSFFQKIRDQIQESLQELEKQARQQRQQKETEPEPSDTTFWDELSEDGDIPQEQEKPTDRETEPAYTRDRADDPIQQMALDSQVEDREIRTPPSPKEVPPPTLHPYGRRPSLRQAVVWAEIIGKPVALRKGSSDAII